MLFIGGENIAVYRNGRKKPELFNLGAGNAMSKPNLAHVIKSVMAAFIGVQSQKNREIDFKHGSLKSYVIVGLIATALFVFAVMAIVSAVIG